MRTNVDPFLRRFRSLLAGKRFYQPLNRARHNRAAIAASKIKPSEPKSSPAGEAHKATRENIGLFGRLRKMFNR